MDSAPHLVELAIAVAARAHAGQVRKGSGIPYIWHPLSVGRCLTQHGLRAEVVATGILHDTLEDTELTAIELEQSFGAEIRRFVEILTEPPKGVRWEERKRRYIERVTASEFEVRIVSAADKLDNLRTTAADLARDGEAIWSKFRKGRAEQRWYYREISSRLGHPGETHAIFGELREVVAEVFGGDP